jgi:hypothetical protein
VPGDTVLLRGGPLDGELCLAAAVVVRDAFSLSVFELERALRHQYDATGVARDTPAGRREEYRYCGTFTCPTPDDLEQLIALASLR